MDLPLVSCVMPTYGRPDYVAESLAMFLAQDYPAKELLILNDCPGQTFVGKFPGVRVVNSPTRWETLGEKRNAAIELAAGEFVAVWDDDDIYLPWRLSQAMTRIQELKANFYLPATYWAYWGNGDLHENKAIMEWIYHPLLVFRKTVWQEVGGYPALTLYEDTGFMKKAMEHLRTEWPRDEVPRFARPMIMRGKSKYRHTCFRGEGGAPDVMPRRISLEARPIEDPMLRAETDRLIAIQQRRLHQGWKKEGHPACWAGVSRETPRRWLDELEPTSVQVGHGELGRSGSLGYEGQRVDIGGAWQMRSLSAHGFSRLTYSLDGRYRKLCCRVAINDDAPADSTAADFLVSVDGRLANVARHVRPHQNPRFMTVDVEGAEEIQLVVQPHLWEHCHSVWIDPFLTEARDLDSAAGVIDAIQCAQFSRTAETSPAEICVATVGSRGFEGWIDDLLGSVCANSRLTNLVFAVFSIGDSDEVRQVANRYGAIVIPCRPLQPVNCSSKAVLYSAGRVVNAEKFICLDADMLVLGELRPNVHAMDAAPPGCVLACRESRSGKNLRAAISPIYKGVERDFETLLGDSGVLEKEYPLVVNDGIFAGTRAALCSLDDHIRSMTMARQWLDTRRRDVPWRNQFLFNLALARGRSGIELDSRFNVQLNSQAAQFQDTEDGMICTSFGQRASVVHFNGGGRSLFPHFRGRFAGTKR